MNNVVLVGRLVKDPEFTMVGANNDRPLCKFRIAVDRRGKDAGTDYINIVVWNSLAETCSKYLAKGRQVGIVGRLQLDSYEVDGERRYAAQVVAHDVEFMSGSKQQGDTASEDDDAGSESDTDYADEEEPAPPAPARKATAKPAVTKANPAAAKRPGGKPQGKCPF